MAKEEKSSWGTNDVSESNWCSLMTLDVQAGLKSSRGMSSLFPAEICSVYTLENFQYVMKRI